MLLFFFASFLVASAVVSFFSSFVYHLLLIFKFFTVTCHMTILLNDQHTNNVCKNNTRIKIARVQLQHITNFNTRVVHQNWRH